MERKYDEGVVKKFKNAALWTSGLTLAFLVLLAAVWPRDKEAVNKLFVTEATAKEPFMFAIDCKRSFDRSMESALIFAEIYDRGEYLGRAPLAELELSRIGQTGEGTLSLRSDADRERHVPFIELAYQEGKDVYSTNQENQTAWSARIPLEDSVMTLGFRSGLDEEKSVEYEIWPQEPCMLGIVCVGTTDTGWITLLEKMTPKKMMSFGEESKEFKECISQNGIFMLVYLVISEESMETLAGRYPAQGHLEIQEAIQ